MDWKSLLFKPADDDTDVEETTEETTEVADEATEEPKTVVTATGGSVNTDIISQIAQVLDEANLPGYDYYEFAKAVESQKEAIPAESVRYNAMFAGGVPGGLTPDTLVNSANHYIKVLDELEESTHEDIQLKIENEVDVNIEIANNLKDQMDAKADQIKQLTTEINALHQDKTEAMTAAEKNKANIQIIANDFAATLAVFKSKIVDDLTKINKYIIQEKTDG